MQEFKKTPLRLTEPYDDAAAATETMLGTVAPVGRPDWGVVVQKPEEPRLRLGRTR